MVRKVLDSSSGLSPRRVRFRAQVSRSGKKLQIIIPQFYHQDMIDNDFVGKVVQVEVKEVKTGSGDFEDEYSVGVGLR